MSQLPEPGPDVPRRAYGPLSTVGRLWLRLTGWRLEGEIPNVSRCVAAVAPHSSNWDFVHAVALVFALRLRVTFIGKHTLFVGPLGRFMRWMGGVPVDRTRPQGIADDAVRALAASGPSWLGIAPEGTRTQGARFKSGFYRIAVAAALPIVPISIDYRRKVIRMHPAVAPKLTLDEGVQAVRDLLLSSGVRRGDA